ncbi:MAG: hypothetical protein M1823_005070 [Watsoniomyces obsoletus]|nr:MAG: hypothetical protein M1823_005070 [Watsoniomyces obsoletus]
MATATETPLPTNPATTTPAPASAVPGESEAHPGPIAPDENNNNNNDNNNQDNPALEIDPELGTDADSTYSDGSSTRTASLTSSIFDYTYENGRRYHAFRQGNYLLPNDEKEQNRLDLYHHMTKLLLDGKLHLAPIGSNPQRILDLGTGTGIWAIDMGDEYPSAEIIGNDLSPDQPNMVPPNVRFLVDDIEDEWVEGSPFDYIHARYLTAAIADWPKLMRQTFAHVKPGGYAEFQDWDIKLFSDDGSLDPESSLVLWDDTCIKAFEILGREPRPGPKLADHLRNAGFQDVQQVLYKLPLGPWPKDEKMKTIGLWNLLNIEEGLDAFVMAPLTRVLGWKEEEVQVLLAKVRQELEKSSTHAYYKFYVAYGRKPGGEETVEDKTAEKV